MNKENSKVVVIIGASSGIGKACADYLSRRNFKVYGTSRKKSDEKFLFNMVEMDVTDTESVQKGIYFILEKENRIDIVVNNAGIGVAGATEEIPIETAKILFDTNFFGTLRVCQSVLPHMRERRQGLIINISSLGGLFGLPFQGIYCASKFALEGLTESLRMETKEFGIMATLVNPGDFKTDFYKNRKKVETNSPYKNSYTKAIEIIEKDETNASDPMPVAVLIYKIIQTRFPRVRYISAIFPQNLTPSLKNILSNKIFERIISFHYNLYMS